MALLPVQTIAEVFRAVYLTFKPVATVLMEQPTVDREGEEVTVAARGRHDPCVVPRAVPVVEAMTALTLLDFYLLSQSTGTL